MSLLVENLVYCALRERYMSYPKIENLVVAPNVKHLVMNPIVDHLVVNYIEKHLVVYSIGEYLVVIGPGGIAEIYSGFAWVESTEEKSSKMDSSCSRDCLYRAGSLFGNSCRIGA